MQVVAFNPAVHLPALVIQRAQAAIPFTVQHGESLVDLGPAFVAEEDGVVYAIAGVAVMWEGRGTAWAIISADAGRYMVRITRAILRFLEVTTVKRIEAAVQCDFPEAHRWIRRLGFKLECERMEAFMPDGTDCALYSRVR